jgi:hypothetical protein
MGSAATHTFFLHRRVILLAKTCPACGLLLDASKFRRYAGHWMTNCNVCQDQTKRYRTDHRQSSFNERCQQMTLPAPNSGNPWPSQDHDILADETMTILDKALTLGRSFYATNIACSKYKYPSRTQPKATNEGGEWVILPSSQRAGYAG